MIFGSVEPLESYCAHLLLSKDEIYFTVLETRGSCALYGPRPATQVYVFASFYNISVCKIYLFISMRSSMAPMILSST